MKLIATWTDAPPVGAAANKSRVQDLVLRAEGEEDSAILQGLLGHLEPPNDGLTSTDRIMTVLARLGRKGGENLVKS